ncbi:MAG: hypothetical protein M3082_17405 [Candidatus Dormibacteraeota bacterium]|nr:hypothetical protein [Candidatus Dormibacteraeota bacterium]
MRVIKVTATPAQSGWTCQVMIAEGGRPVSVHHVTVSTSDVEKLSPGSSVEELVKRSFEYLLEREPPQSILPRFSLQDIERYFPDYPATIRQRD